MAKKYEAELQTAQWRKKRAQIKKRDGNRCVKCGATKLLQVHHKKYIIGRKAWEAPNEHLETLCRDCHEKEHEGKDIATFRIKEKNKKHKAINKKRAAEKKKLKVAKMKQKKIDKFKAAVRSMSAENRRLASEPVQHNNLSI